LVGAPEVLRHESNYYSILHFLIATRTTRARGEGAPIESDRLKK